jgi:hypothetical protein
MFYNEIQFQAGFSPLEFQRLYGSEEQWVALGLLRCSSSSGESSMA